MLHAHFTFKLWFTCSFFHAIQFHNLENGFTKDPHAVFFLVLVGFKLSFHHCFPQSAYTVLRMNRLCNALREKHFLVEALLIILPFIVAPYSCHSG